MNSEQRLLVRLNWKVRRAMRTFDASLFQLSIKIALSLGIIGIGAIARSFYRSNLKASQHGPSVILTMSGGDTIDLTADQRGPLKAEYAIAKTDTGPAAMKAPGVVAEPEWNTLEVPEGKTYSLELPDNTEVKLNSASSLHFPFSFTSARREVYLDGEAFFKVPQQSLPFIIHTPKGDIKTSGGEINIETYDSVFTVSVFTDTAWIRSSGRDLVLLPGQALTRNKSGKGLTVGLFDLEMILSRLQGKYVFAGDPLDNVGKVIERWFATRVVFDEKEMLNRPYYGVIYKDQSLDFFLQDLQKTDNISSYFDDAGKLHLK